MLFYLRTKAGIVETICLPWPVFGSYLVFTMLLDFFGYGFGSSMTRMVGNWYFLMRSVVYLLLAVEYILVSRYFVKVFREKDQVFLSNGQTAVFLLIPFLMLALILALYLNGDTLLMIYGYGSLAVAVLGIVLFHLLVIYLFGYMIGQQKKNLQYQLYEQQKEMMMHQYRELEEKYQASRKVIHDVKIIFR